MICPVHGCRMVEPQPIMEKRGGEWTWKPADPPFCRRCLIEKRLAEAAR